MGVKVTELQSNDQAEYKSTTVFSKANHILLIIYIYIYMLSDPVTGPVWPRGWVEV